ncbi:RagB/SusD family nutrient uptake outer membrane protein [Flagellimonas onchidii]|uniref:RagB/SusD family nutrient uptake outer membrane protein n=1 Tax=Flagellimonas onchidii TaxID=2562684 RepID=UPI001455F635|nr:RagB/SusD family nutrient uptake outer membrane protein [Allomuricauda onchidii]
MKNIQNMVLITLMVFIASSCDDVLEPEPQGQIPLSDLFTDEDNAITAVNGMYSALTGIYNNAMGRMSIMASDDAWTWRANEEATDYFIVEDINGQAQTFWRNSYILIGRTNSVIEGLPNVPWENPELESASEGQAKFMRALAYFNLVRFYGAVPLILNQIRVPSEAAVPRTSVQEVYNQIEADLNDAINLLPTSYSGGNGLEVGKATRYAAQILKAYVHLEQEEWADAASLATGLIGTGTLLNFADNFNGTNENSSGTFFEIQYGGPGTPASSYLGSGNAFRPLELSGNALMLPTDDNFIDGSGNSIAGVSAGGGFLQAFEAGDNRRDVTLGNTFNGTILGNFIVSGAPDGSLFYVTKYYNEAATLSQQGSPWNFPLYRYADALLVSAEALNEQGYVAGGDAFDYLNEVRIHAGLSALTATDLPNQTSFRAAVAQERRIEFAFEFKRFFDLNRWGILGDVVGNQLELFGLTFPSNRAPVHPITGKSYFLYPVPAIEFANNANLGDQNPGYN